MLTTIEGIRVPICEHTALVDTPHQLSVGVPGWHMRARTYGPCSQAVLGADQTVREIRITCLNIQLSSQ